MRKLLKNICQVGVQVLLVLLFPILPTSFGVIQPELNLDEITTSLVAAGCTKSISELEQGETIATIDPSSEDVAGLINEAINRQEQPASGKVSIIRFRAGIYRLKQPIRIDRSNIGLIGDGTAETQLIAPESGGDAAIVISPSVIGGESGELAVPHVVKESARINSKIFHIDDADDLKIGDSVKLIRTSSPDWIRRVKYGERSDGKHWKVGKVDSEYLREIRSITKGNVEFDAPIPDEIDVTSSPSYLVKDRVARISSVLVSRLSITVRQPEGSGDSRSREGIAIGSAKDIFIDRVSVRRFATAAIEIADHSKHITIDSCTASEPMEAGVKNRGYGFKIKSSQLIRINRSSALKCRYSLVFIGGGQTSSVVVSDCVSESPEIGAFASFGAWSHGYLIENLRGVYGASPGRISLSSLAVTDADSGWNMVNVLMSWVGRVPDQIIVRRPPIGYNYIVVSKANLADLDSDMIDQECVISQK